MAIVRSIELPLSFEFLTARIQEKQKMTTRSKAAKTAIGTFCLRLAPKNSANISPENRKYCTGFAG